VRAGWIKQSDIPHMTLDQVDLGNLYLDALEEAELIAEEQAEERRRGASGS